MNAFECYLEYLAIKTHFANDKYDYFEHNGAVKAKPSTFEKRKDKQFFYVLSKKFNRQDLKFLFLANIIKNDGLWIGQAISEDAIATYYDWRKRIESLTYVIKQDITRIRDFCDKKNCAFQDLILVNKGQHPTLLMLYQQNEITLETLLILDGIYHFLGYWDTLIADRIIWPILFKKCYKYLPFFRRLSAERHAEIAKREINT